MNKSRYKYRFHYLLRQLTVNDYEIAMKWIPERIMISASTWRKWIYLKSDSHLQLSFCSLRLLASFFQCSIPELFSDPQDFEDIRAEFENYKKTYNV